MITLLPIDQVIEADRLLFNLLAERPPEANISHRSMPTWREHCDFVRSKPYAAWYLIQGGEACVGAIYLSKQREVGVGIFEAHRGKGYGTEAIKAIRALHPGPLLANIAPANHRSKKLFNDLGFRPVQHTYRID